MFSVIFADVYITGVNLRFTAHINSPRWAKLAIKNLVSISNVAAVGNKPTENICIAASSTVRVHVALCGPTLPKYKLEGGKAKKKKNVRALLEHSLQCQGSCPLLGITGPGAVVTFL